VNPTDFFNYIYIYSGFVNPTDQGNHASPGLRVTTKKKKAETKKEKKNRKKRKKKEKKNEAKGEELPRS
jgi:hypothetical protein